MSATGDTAGPTNGGTTGSGSSPTNGGGKPAAAATTALTDNPPVVPAKAGPSLELGPACAQCGGMMQRTGSCYTC
jgi:ribonucleoside-diphosphate reductase alpha chain